jgi:hypothetical protein
LLRRRRSKAKPARRFGLTISPDLRPNAGTYYRSDHFSFARVGIPSFSIEGGQDLSGKPPERERSCSPGSTISIIINRRTNITTIGISR